MKRSGGPYRSAELRGDLDNIVLMAMRKEPERRYSSAQALSDDISNYLNRYPVAARPPTVRYRISRFYLRNRIATLITIVLGLTLAAGIVATGWQSIVSRRQRDRAEQRFLDVRNLSRSLLFELTPRIERLPGSTEARGLIIARAVEYLDELSSESQGDRDLQMELATAYEKIGDLQGNPANPNLIAFDDAIASFERAIQIRKSLLEPKAPELENQLRIAENFRLLGGIHGQANDYEAEQRQLAVAAGMYESLAAHSAGRTDIRIALARTNYDIGVGKTSLGSYASAIPFYDRAISILVDVLAAHPADIEARRLIALARAQKAYSLSWEDRQPEAEEEMRQAVSIAEQLYEADTAQFQGRDTLRMVYWLAGNINEEIDDARFYEFQLRSTGLARDGAKMDPADLRGKQLLAKSLSHLGQAAINVGRLSEAIGHLDESVKGYQDIVEAKSRNTRLRSELASSLLRLGSARTKMGDVKQGLTDLAQAEQIYSGVVEEFPGDKRSANNLASAYATIAKIYANEGRSLPNAHRSAQANFQNALGVMLRLESQGVLSEFDRKFLDELKQSVEAP